LNLTSPSQRSALFDVESTQHEPSTTLQSVSTLPLISAVSDMESLQTYKLVL